MKNINYIIWAVLCSLLIGCGPRYKVNYDDPGALRPLSTSFTLSDLNQVADAMVGSMLTSPGMQGITKDGQRPILIVDRVRNDTDQHIDTESITDTIRTELIQSGVFRFTDKVSREWQRDEINWQNNSGMVASDKAIQKGRQLGAQYMVTGRIVSYSERTHEVERKSYKFTLNLINLDTGIIEWAGEKPITKMEARRSFGY